MVFAPDGKTLLEGGPTLAEGQGLPACDVTVQIWDVTGARLLKRVVLKGKDYRVSAIAFSPDVKTLVAADTNRRLIWWDLASAQRLREWLLPSPASSQLAFAADGRRVAIPHLDGMVSILHLPQLPQGD
jgi:WD40 repeat protein